MGARGVKMKENDAACDELAVLQDYMNQRILELPHTDAGDLKVLGLAQVYIDAGFSDVPSEVLRRIEFAVTNELDRLHCWTNPAERKNALSDFRAVWKIRGGGA